MKINRSRLIIETTLDAIAKSYDRHTRYLSAKMKESLDRKLQTSYVGIGLEMSYVAGRILIENVLPGSAAAESGQILSGSIIQSVNSEKGNLDRPSNIKEISEIISGPEGGWVEITVLNKKGEESNVRLIRKKIQLIDEWVHGETMEVNGKKIGIVTIPSFYKGDDKNVAVDVAHMMRLLNQKNIDAVIFDVRGNSGGDLESAVSIASFLIGKETAVVVIDASFRKQPVEGGGPILFKGPTAILIDGNSASASEVLAGAILDNGGDIIGKSHSYGKGTVQEIISLKPYFATNLTVMSWIGSLKCTVREFISPKGTKIDGVGFQPTILIKGTIDHPSEIKTGSIIQVNERLETVEEKNSISFDDSKMEAVERFALKLSR